MAAALAVPIIAGAANLIGNMLGGSSASKAMRETMKDNQNWFDRRYNEDFTQRADAQRMLSILENDIRKRNKSAAGTSVVMGGNEESVAAAKEANNQALSDAVAKIVATGEARKDQIEQQYRENKNAMKTQRAMNTAQAIQGVGNAAANVVGALGDDIWSRGGYAKVSPGQLTQQRMINDAVAQARLKDLGSYIGQV